MALCGLPGGCASRHGRAWSAAAHWLSKQSCWGSRGHVDWVGSAHTSHNTGWVAAEIPVWCGLEVKTSKYSSCVAYQGRSLLSTMALFWLLLQPVIGGSQWRDRSSWPWRRSSHRRHCVVHLPRGLQRCNRQQFSTSWLCWNGAVVSARYWDVCFQRHRQTG